MEITQDQTAAEAARRVPLGPNLARWLSRMGFKQDGQVQLQGNNNRLRSSAEPMVRPKVNRVFHTQMLCATITILFLSFLGCMLTSVRVPGAFTLLLGLVIGGAAILPFPLYMWDKGWEYLPDALLTILWSFLLYCILNFPVTIAARLGAVAPLHDSHFMQLDSLLGIHVPSIMAWSDAHGFRSFSDKCYYALIPSLWAAVFLPTLAGKARDTQQFLTANLIAFAIGLPIFALLPAIGPWYGYHLPMGRYEAECQALIFQIRQPGPFTYHPPAGIICFPSFHVIWAILCARSLWGFRLLRIPVSILSLMIIASTLTTGVHYFCDVLAGIILATIAIIAANRIAPRQTSGPASMPVFEVGASRPILN